MRKRWLPVLTLIILAPVCGELLSGDHVCAICRENVDAADLEQTLQAAGLASASAVPIPAMMKGIFLQVTGMLARS
ncbi:MAG: hypothetical protein HPY76_01445 [Anaerolineae bacterium]|nr:hypothetical protein [Anaerolineae bacterium]